MKNGDVTLWDLMGFYGMHLTRLAYNYHSYNNYGLCMFMSLWFVDISNLTKTRPTYNWGGDHLVVGDGDLNYGK